MKAVTYSRVSTEDQAKNGVSLNLQSERIKAYAAYKGFSIVHEISDDGVSGGKNKTRPGFMKLLDLVAAGGVDAIILYDQDRISRDMLTTLALERLLHEYDVELHTVDGQIDTSTPTGFMNLAMKAFLGEMERRQIRYRTKRALNYKKEQGVAFNHAPYGFRKQGKDLIPDLNEQAVIKTINEMYEAGQRLVDIVDHLNGNGIAAKKGGAWSAQQVKNLIAEYTGTFKKGKTAMKQATRRFIEAIA